MLKYLLHFSNYTGNETKHSAMCRTCAVLLVISDILSPFCYLLTSLLTFIIFIIHVVLYKQDLLFTVHLGHKMAVSLAKKLVSRKKRKLSK